MRADLTKQEYKWLADLTNKAKIEADLANKDTPHPLLELRRDNMAALETKINDAIQKQIQREGRNVR
jgi:hypothetical protein